MKLTPSQKIIAKSNKRFRVLNCGRRFGKTTEAIEEIKGKALGGNKNDRIVYIAPTYQQARDIAWEMLKRELEPIIKKVNESRLELEVYNQHQDSVYIILRGWESIETLRGQKFTFLVLDEVAMMRNFWVGWHEVLRPALADLKGGALFISTPKGFNHFYDLYNLAQDPIKGKEYESFHFTTRDNPFIPSEEIDKAQQEMEENRFAQEYMADFRKAEGLVYKDFDRSKHVFSEVIPIREIRRIASVDFGWTNPTCVLTIVIDYDNNYWVLDEMYKTQKNMQDIIQYCKTTRASEFYPDPAEPDRIEEMKLAGLNVQEVSKDIEFGITCVQKMFKTNKIKIHSSCVNLISELETYHYPDKKPDHNEPELPVKENDHAMDALRYALYNTAPVEDDTSMLWKIARNRMNKGTMQ